MAQKKIVISTETWNTKTGKVYKAVVRTADGKFLGATNQTTVIPVKAKARRKPSPTLILVGK